MKQEECPLWPRCRCRTRGEADYTKVKPLKREGAFSFAERLRWLKAVRRREKTLKEIAAKTDISYVRVWQHITLTEIQIKQACNEVDHGVY